MELVIFVGLQGAGKSTYFRKHFAMTHAHVSKDLMRNKRNKSARQHAQIEEALRNRRSVVVDNTNPTRHVRAPLIAQGRAHHARVLACYFVPSLQDSLHRNRQRTGRARVPDVAIYSTASKLEPPTLSEGFDEIVYIL